MKPLKYFGYLCFLMCVLSVCTGCINKQDAKTEGDLPVRYDLREHRNLTSVENQGIQGTCWAFASTAMLEILPSVEAGTRFSVDHMTMNSGFDISPSDGGDYNMAIAYLAAWKGPVFESEDPYGDGETNPNACVTGHLQEAQILDGKDIDEMKQMILAYGGLESPIYMSIFHAQDESEDYNPECSAYYYSGEFKANHDVVIIGWDDAFKKENFNHMPESDGAFICRNSWGETFGEDGYFYVSYEDAVLGERAVAYTRFEKPDNYSRIYQSDVLGWVGTLGYGEETAWFSNVYTAEENEMLKAVGFYAVEAHSNYEIYVVPEYTEPECLSRGIHIKSGSFDKSGYYTVDFEEDIQLEGGKDFAVVVRMTTENCERPIAIEYRTSDLTKNAVLEDSRGFVSYDGYTWMSSEQEYECNICLKAFTE